MNVGELIEELKKHDHKKEVKYSYYDSVFQCYRDSRLCENNVYEDKEDDCLFVGL